MRVRRLSVRPYGWIALVLVVVVVLAPLAAAADLRLLEAVKRQDAEAISILLREHADVNAAQPDGATALHWAVHWDDVTTAQRLLGAGARVNAANELGVTPLSMACENGHGPMVTVLLQGGADPNLTLGARPPALMLCAHTGSLDGVKALVARGANVNAREPRRDQTALMWAVAERHPDIVRVLLDHGADLHARSRLSRLRVNLGDPNDIYTGVVGDVSRGSSTALLFATRSGDVQSARLLLDAGANVNDSAPDGNSALIVAVHSNQTAVARLLLQKGANPNVIGGGYTALHAAVLRGNPDLVKALLAAHALVNSQVRHGTPTARATREFFLPQTVVGATPAFLASQFLEPELLQVLVNSGANVRLPLADGTTPLMAAAGVMAPLPLFDRRRRLTLVQADDEPAALSVVTRLLELGADVNATNDAGDTAVHGAAKRGYPRVVELLAGRGARLDTRNKRGQTPVDVANGEKIAALLRSLGAKP